MAKLFDKFLFKVSLKEEIAILRIHFRSVNNSDLTQNFVVEIVYIFNKIVDCCLFQAVREHFMIEEGIQNFWEILWLNIDLSTRSVKITI